jgi:LuxR family maltose regulon positive regulatory protein
MKVTTLLAFSGVTSSPLTREQVTTLEERTEGWITGLQMAALSIQGRDPTQEVYNMVSISHLAHFGPHRSLYGQAVSSRVV